MAWLPFWYELWRCFVSVRRVRLIQVLVQQAPIGKVVALSGRDPHELLCRRDGDRSCSHGGRKTRSPGVSDDGSRRVRLPVGSRSLMFPCDYWLRSPLPSGTGWDKNFRVVSTTGTTFIEGSGYGYGTRVATARSVAFGFLCSGLLRFFRYRWLRSPWQQYSNLFRGVAAGGQVWPDSSSGSFGPASSRCVAFGFDVQSYKFALFWWLRSPRATMTNGIEVSSETGSMTYSSVYNPHSVAFGFQVRSFDHTCLRRLRSPQPLNSGLVIVSATDGTAYWSSTYGARTPGVKASTEEGVAFGFWSSPSD